MTALDSQESRYVKQTDKNAEFHLEYTPPYNWDAVMAFLRQRTVEGIEDVVDDCYWRLVCYDNKPGLVAAVPVPEMNCLHVKIYGVNSRYYSDVCTRLRNLFDLDAHPKNIMAVLQADPIFSSRLKSEPGIRLPGSWDPFEMAVRAVVGQQVSVKAARTLAGRLVQRCGTRLELRFPQDVGQPLSLSHVFPIAQQLKDADLDKLGITGRRISTIKNLSNAVVNGQIILDREAGSKACVESLLQLPGIGPWTAQYIIMRALGDPDAFPEGDLGLIKALKTFYPDVTAKTLKQHAEKWRPWRAYAVMLLWNIL